MGPPPGLPSAGVPYGQPPAVPPATAAPSSGRALFVVLGILASLVLIVGVVGVVIYVRSGQDAGGEVFLEAAAEPGENPFTTAVSSQAAQVSTTSFGGRAARVSATNPPATSSRGTRGSGGSSTTAPATTAPSTSTTLAAGQVPSVAGAQPGLYGGTQNLSRCDPAQLVAFLEANPDKALAWIDALNKDSTLRWSGGSSVGVGQIRAFVAELTPLTLTADVRVTNHGFANGRATPRQAVLQAGTAVLVDRYGVPRAKCACGNPLTAPVPVKSTPVYRGTPWPGWNPGNVIVVQQSVTIVDVFVIVNVDGPGYLERPAGSNGSKDAPSTYDPEAGIPAGGSAGTSPPRTAGGGTTTSTRRPTTTTTAAPTTTESTVPPPTLTREEYCSVARELFAWAAGANDATAAELAKFRDYLNRLEASAPPSVAGDWAIIRTYLDQLLAGGANALEPDAATQAAEARLIAELQSDCGITVPK